MEYNTFSGISYMQNIQNTLNHVYLNLNEDQKKNLNKLFQELNILGKQREEINSFIYFKELEIKHFTESLKSIYSPSITLDSSVFLSNMENSRNDESKDESKDLSNQSFEKEKKLSYSEVLLKNISTVLPSKDMLLDSLKENGESLSNDEYRHEYRSDYRPEWYDSVDQYPCSDTIKIWNELNKPLYFFKFLFQRNCRSCGNEPKSKTCKVLKKCHVQDKNFEFSCLPYNARCMRKVCMDLSCNRRHHEKTIRIPVQCNQKEDCKCPHYVHPGDVSEGKPSFWMPYELCMSKPPKQIIDSYFLLFKKF